MTSSLSGPPEAGSVSLSATGLKGKVGALANSLSVACEELHVDRSILDTIRGERELRQGELQVQLDEARRFFQAEIQRMEEEFRAQAQLQKTENGRIQQSVTSLKAEKTSLHQQILSLQRRIEEIEEEVGHD
ncbi:unnamed protein product [Vitrella brassicaformis CCMP3155]|uniref:Uncharacterized protein n=2 Tax=Vitrella brassicaformis TaxID=1169539 RepID=A0A0G4FCJ3_VITBC|nr:unnamed protein product [Vitrella brassicaformis CCMP3155]|eukprot:CEM10940.1 unnamed protein product [Vitrella brassicaformis CCMP3155]